MPKYSVSGPSIKFKNYLHFQIYKYQKLKFRNKSIVFIMLSSFFVFLFEVFCHFLFDFDLFNWITYIAISSFAWSLFDYGKSGINFFKTRDMSGSQIKRQFALSNVRFFDKNAPVSMNADVYPAKIHFFGSDGADQLLLTSEVAGGFNYGIFDLRLLHHLSVNNRIEMNDNLDENYEKSIIKTYPEKYNGYEDVILKIHQLKMSQENKNFFNQKKISLKSFDFKESTVTAGCGTTSYFTSVITNDSYKYCLKDNKGNGNDIEDLRRLYPCTYNATNNQFYLKPFHECIGVSNHVGSVVFAITSDGVPVFCRQMNNSRMYANRYVASGAGSLELTDYQEVLSNDDPSFDKFVRYGMARELLEETGIINQNKITKNDCGLIFDYISNIELISYYRDVSRGGLPIFVGFSVMRESYKEITNLKPIETRLVSGINAKVNNVSDYKNFIDHYSFDGESENKDFSDQVVFFRQLLDNELVAKIIDKKIRSRRTPITP